MTKPTSRTRTLLLGTPTGRPYKLGSAGKAIGWTTLILMVLFTAQTAYQLYLTPNNPGWWAVAWVFGGIAFMAGGHLFGLLPQSAGANGLMVATYLLGFLAVPFGAHFLLTWNVAVGFVAVLLGVPFALAIRYYARMVQAHAG